MEVWNYDPISRGLKHHAPEIEVRTVVGVWNYDPISRGLKHGTLGLKRVRMTRRLEL